MVVSEINKVKEKIRSAGIPQFRFSSLYYQDRGCEVWDKCFACPFKDCIDTDCRQTWSTLKWIREMALMLNSPPHERNEYNVAAHIHAINCLVGYKARQN